MALAPLSDDVQNMSYTELKARVEVLTRRVNSLTSMKIAVIGSDQTPSITITEANSTLSIPEATDCSAEIAELEAEIVALEAEIVALEAENAQLSDFLDESLKAEHPKPTEQSSDAIGGDGYYFIRNIYGHPSEPKAGSYWLYVYQQGNTVYYEASWSGDTVESPSNPSDLYKGGGYTSISGVGSFVADSTTTSHSGSFFVSSARPIGWTHSISCRASTSKLWNGTTNYDYLDNNIVQLKLVQQTPLIMEFVGTPWRNGDSTY